MWTHPIVAVTANATVESLAQCLDSGMDDCLTKPFKPEQLHGALKRAARAALGMRVEGPKSLRHVGRSIG